MGRGSTACYGRHATRNTAMWDVSSLSFLCNRHCSLWHEDRRRMIMMNNTSNDKHMPQTASLDPSRHSYNVPPLRTTPSTSSTPLPQRPTELPRTRCQISPKRIFSASLRTRTVGDSWRPGVSVRVWDCCVHERAGKRRGNGFYGDFRLYVGNRSGRRSRCHLVRMDVRRVNSWGDVGSWSGCSMLEGD